MSHALLLAPLPPRSITDHVPEVEVVTPTTRQEARVGAAGAVVCLAAWQADGIVLDDELAAALAPTCRLVQVPAAGLDGLDLGACRRHGLTVSSAAGLNAVAVAEWAVWAVLDALGGLAAGHAALQGGGWRTHDRRRAELRGRRVGIVGMGHAGRALLPRLAPFEASLAYWNRTRDRALERATGVVWRDLDALVATSDVLVLAVASTPETRHLLDGDRLSALPDGAVVVNAARGEVWDAAAVGAALATRHLSGAATDVYAVEPPPSDHPLLGAHGATTTPHVAGLTREAVGALRDRIGANLRRAVAGDTDFEGVLTPR